MTLQEREELVYNLHEVYIEEFLNGESLATLEDLYNRWLEAVEGLLK